MRHITLSEYLRPWARAGISHLLIDVNSSQLDLAETEQSLPQEMFDEQSVTFKKPFDSAYASNTNGNSEQRQSLDEKVSKSESSQSFSVNYNAPKADLPSFLEQHSYATPSDLPSHWQVLLAKTPHAPVVWTYSDLGHDLVYKSSKERSACLRALIGKLSLPKGSSSFLPYSLPVNDKEIDVNIDAFYFGLTQISPKVIIFFGEDASQKVAPSLDLTVIFKQRIHGGKLFILLPSLSVIASNSHLFDSACSYLRSVLTFLSPK